jgi:glycerol-3-phosphate acyltransferase PlsY
MEYLLIIAFSYVIGSIPNGLIVGKLLKGVDIRQFGSKNIGATNMYRVLGPWPAFWVLITDIAKGVAGVYVGKALLGTPTAALLGGIAAITGHNWSLFLGFKGGRGVATALGVIAVLMPKVTVIVFLVWAVIVFFTRYVSLGSIVAAAFAPPLTWWLVDQPEYLYFVIVAAAFVIIRHRPNIERLRKGQELKIKAGSAAPPEKKGEDQP